MEKKNSYELKLAKLSSELVLLGKQKNPVFSYLQIKDLEQKLEGLRRQIGEDLTYYERRAFPRSGEIDNDSLKVHEFCDRSLDKLFYRKIPKELETCEFLLEKVNDVVIPSAIAIVYICIVALMIKFIFT